MQTKFILFLSIYAVLALIVILFTPRKKSKEPEVGPIILSGTSGDDYEVLNKVNRNIKAAAVNELPVNEDLNEALGPDDKDLTPQNKRWILITMLFKPVEGKKYQWTHPALGDQIVNYDINTEPLFMIISRVFKSGRKDYENQLSNQIKKA